MKEPNINMPPQEVSRDVQAEKISKFIERTDTFDYVKDLLNDKIEKPSFDDFKNFLIRINGIARDIPINERSFDGKNVMLSGGYDESHVPKHEDKEDILKYAYNHISQVEQEDLKFLLPGLVNALHFFHDGNGRTSRVLHQLLAKHNSKEDFKNNLKISLEEKGRYNSINVNPSLIYGEIEDMIMKGNGWEYNQGEPSLKGARMVASKLFSKINTDTPLYNKLQQFHQIASIEQVFAITALHKVVGEKMGTLFIENIHRNDLISYTKLSENVSEDEWDKIFDEYYKLKKEQVTIFVDMFIKPEQYTLNNDPNKTLKDKFIGKVEQMHQLLN